MTDSRQRTVPFERGSTLVVGLVIAAALVLAALWWWDGRSRSAPVVTAPAIQPGTAGPAAPSASVVDSRSPAPTTGPAPPVTVTVDIRGAVRAPGPRELPAGSRVIDAVNAAGGLQAGSRYGPLNLARILTDGEQIRVGPADPAPSAGASAATPSAAAADSGSGLINLNTADAVTLEEVDGVGPVLAEAIIEWRTTNGPFGSVDDLLDVSGIGDATLAGMRDQVTVG